MRYKTVKTDIIDPCIHSSEWERAEIGEIKIRNWDVDYIAPETYFKVLCGPEGLSVYFHTKETNLRAECKEENGRVCDDSCVEFFFKPDPWDTRYMNFEINPKGVMYLGIGSGRDDNEKLYVDRTQFSIETIPNEGDWSTKIYIPYSFLSNYFKSISKVCKANFYKCGELTSKPHYASWSPISVPQPDFHTPDFFGFLEF